MKIIVVLFVFMTLHAVSAQTDSIKVLSWNVFLRPAILKDGQIKRVDSISAYLNNTGADVLILQEVFHRRARKKLIATLSEHYSYFTKIGPKSFWGVPSGVLIASKDSMSATRHLSFKKGASADKMAKKGGIAATIIHNSKMIHIVGTHLQAGRGTDKEIIRRRQVKKLKRLSNNMKDLRYAPIIFAGDFNIPFGSDNFDFLQDTLNVSCKKPTGIVKATSNFSDSDLYPTTGKPQWIDFVLIERGQQLKTSDCYIVEPRAFYGKSLKKRRLSDHNPIINVISIPNEN
jgi:phospholipase C